jgi:hypothetical protein
MDNRYVSAQLSILINDLDLRIDGLLREEGVVLADNLDRSLRSVESLIDDLYFAERHDDGKLRVARAAIDELRSICRRLPATLEAAVGSSAYDRLRALGTDLELEAR